VEMLNLQQYVELASGMKSTENIMTRKRIFERLRIRLNRDLQMDLPEDVEFRRTYAGHWQRSAGAFNWIVYHSCMIGSCYPARDLLKSKRLISDDSDRNGDIEIYPIEETSEKFEINVGYISGYVSRTHCFRILRDPAGDDQYRDYETLCGISATKDKLRKFMASVQWHDKEEITCMRCLRKLEGRR
jgi:hypothetical protein